MRVLVIAVLIVISACAGTLDRPGFRPQNIGIDLGKFQMLCGKTSVPTLVEIDYAVGHRPSGYAIEQLERVIHRACGKQAHVAMDVRIDQALALQDTSPSQMQIEALAREHISLLEEADRNGFHYAYVLYVPYLGDRMVGRGFAKSLLVGHRLLPFACLAAGNIGDHSLLWVTQRKLEASVLVHEFGHLLGLKLPHRNHCYRPTCVMYHDADARFVWGNMLQALFLGTLPNDYCENCRRRLALARRRPAPT